MAEPSGGMEKALSTRIAGIPAWALSTVLAVGIIGFIVYRNHQKNKVNNQNANQNDQAGGNPQDPNAIDPATGMTYGQEGAGDITGYPNTPLDSYLAQNPTNPAYPTGLTPQGLPGPVTNAQWSRLAADNLLAKGDDPTLVEGALSKYLNGTVLSTAEQAVVNTALTIFGSPPEGVKAPVTNAGTPGAPQNMRTVATTSTSIKVSCDSVAGASGYTFYRQRTGGAWTTVTTTVGNNAPTFTDAGLKHNAVYTYSIAAFNSVGYGPKSSTLSARTKK